MSMHKGTSGSAKPKVAAVKKVSDAAMQHRLNVYEAICTNFSFLRNLNTSSSSDITVAAERLVRAYPEDLERNLSVELIQFVSFVKSTQDLQTLASKEPNIKIGNELRLFLLLTELSLDQTFPNVYIMFRIYLCMMITNCEGERSFSKLARIKNQLRSAMWARKVWSCSPL